MQISNPQPSEQHLTTTMRIGQILLLQNPACPPGFSIFLPAVLLRQAYFLHLYLPSIP